jgi:uncharacterized protein YggL (DUF469 family)
MKQPINLNKKRSPRLRKKLRIGEFRELGFGLEFVFKKDLSEEDVDLFIDAFLSEAIEPRLLAYGGGIGSGFVAKFGRGSASEEDRASVQNWLLVRPEVKDVNAGPLVDVWHHPF